MSTVKVIDVVSRVESILQDSGVRWPRLELQNWINESYLNIVLMRPDANSVDADFPCVEGTRQSLTTAFPNALRLLDVTRNTAALSAKKVVRLVSRADLDEQRATWHAEAGTLDIQHFAFDARQPKSFFVYPPAVEGASIEVVYVEAPGSHALTAEELDPTSGNEELIKLDDIYMSPMIDWVLYRAYSKDAENPVNEARAMAAYQAFSTSIGVKTQSDAAVVPEAV